MSKKKKLIPELRFPEFKNEGEWEIIKLKQFGTFYRGLTYGAADTASNGLLVLRSGNIQNDTLVLNKDLVFVEKECPENLKLLNGDIVICMSNGSKALVGKNAEYKGNYEGNITVGAFCSILRPKNSYTKYLLQSDVYQDFIALSIGGGNINNLKNSDLEEFRCSAANNPKEQQKIASCLSSLDDLIAAHNQKLELLKEHKKGLIQNLFPQEGEKVPKYRFKEFKKDGEWVKKKLGELGTFIGGGTPSRSNNDYWTGEIPWISSSDIDEDDIHNILITEFINEIAVSESATKIIPIGSVLFVSRVGVGKFAINKKELCTSQDFISFVPNGILNYFIAYYFSAKKDILLSLSQGTSIKGFSKSDLEEQIIFYPRNPTEQQKIASVLSSLDEIITSQTEKVEQLKLHKKGLMQGLFPKMIG